MQTPNFDTIAQHPTVQKLFVAHAPKHACTAQNVQSLAKQSAPFRTALTLLINSELEKQHIAQAHQASCDEACQWQRAHDAQAQELQEAHKLAEKVNELDQALNNTGKDAAKKEKTDLQKAAEMITNLVNGVNKTYINPDDTKAKEEAEIKKQNESNSWIWWGLGALGLLLGGLWYMSSTKKTT